LAITRHDFSQGLEGLIARFERMIRSVGRRYRLDSSDVDELLQNVRVRLWQTRGAASETESIESTRTSYVYRAAVTAAIDIFRQRRSRAESLGDTVSRDIAARRVGPEQDAELGDLTERVQAALDSIVESRRVVVRMHLAGYPKEEITTLLGHTPAQTRNLLYRGLADLREALTRRGITPEEF
jgi:RNA polymerase sigma-70 factor (ECF subfamily)